MKSIVNNTLSKKDYLGHDVVRLAQLFLGSELHTLSNNLHTAGRIVEVEAYCGAMDRACHAYPEKRTKRTATMYRAGGVAYIYLVYGMHHLFNIVTNTAGRADAILVRAIEPLVGLDIMKQRRNLNQNNKLLTGGPARLSQALGITTRDNGTDLTGNRIWLTKGNYLKPDNIVAATRIGVDYAGEDALLPWRFYIKDNIYVSK